MTTLGRYELKERLGQGGMATVWRAVDTTLGREVAVKVMHQFVAERAEASRRFEREARAIAGLRHSNVMQIHDYHPQQGETPAYLVMELLSGPSLRAFIDRHGAPLAEVGALIGLRVAQALDAAHARNIVHRDVKPENVMFDIPESQPIPRVVLCDFGVARMQLEGQTGMTATGAVIGSPAYMSPEQARGDEVDARSDLFSLGSLLYVLATGAAPFQASQPLAVMNRIVKGEHAPPSAKNPRVPRWLERVIERCLRVRPEDRFPSATAVVEALSDGLRDDGVVDLDGELASYLRDPPAYNEGFRTRIIAHSLEQARSAQAEKKAARALAAASRVLAWEPDHPEAMSFVSRLQPRSRAWLMATTAIVVLGGSGTVAAVLLREPARPTVLVTQDLAPSPIAVAQRSAPSPAPEPFDLATPFVARARVRKKASAVNELPPPTEELAREPRPEPVETVPREDKPQEARLAVTIAPWCDLSVDGEPRGRTPQTLTLTPGRHRVDCKNPVSGANLTREVELIAGETTVIKERLYAAARITPRLLRGDAFSLDNDAPASASRDAAPGRHRVTLFAGGKTVETRWVDVRPEGCRLVDTPALTCEKP